MVQATEVQDRPSLYDRLGGVYSIATVVDDFIDRVMGDPRLNANPLVDEAHHRVTAAGFKYLVTECFVGPLAGRRGIRVAPWTSCIATCSSPPARGRPS